MTAPSTTTTSHAAHVHAIAERYQVVLVFVALLVAITRLTGGAFLHDAPGPLSAPASSYADAAPASSAQAPPPASADVGASGVPTLGAGSPLSYGLADDGNRDSGPSSGSDPPEQPAPAPPPPTWTCAADDNLPAPVFGPLLQQLLAVEQALGGAFPVTPSETIAAQGDCRASAQMWTAPAIGGLHAGFGG